MSATAPHYLLLTQAILDSRSADPAPGHWRFVLATPDGQPTLQAEDDEHSVSPERLELLAVIRGLESIDSPSRVILLNASPRLRRALDHDLSRWRDDDWHWERFGRMVPIKNADLWRRLDRLRTIHAVECGPATLQAADDLRPPPAVASTHLVLGGRRLRIDRPGAHGALEHVSADLVDTSSVRRARGSTLRHAAVRQGSLREPVNRPRQRFDRGPPSRHVLRSFWAACGRWWDWLTGRLAARGS
jgi:ribonuclease HI